MHVAPENWERVRQLFEAALERDPEERASFLEQACGDQPGLRAEVASLLDVHTRTGDFLDAPAFKAAASLLVDDTPATEMEGRTIGPYIIRHEIGRGGMGVVYLADDTRLGRRVALKALPPRMSGDADRRERLRQEARAAAALVHPGIATVYALEEIGDELYIACEYVPGRTLHRLLEAGPVPIAQVLDIAVQVARALAAAHMQGVVHRDLKTENVIRTPAGVTKILDFGIARADNLASNRVTAEGAIVGTPACMAPEQARGEPADSRADLFAFGVLVYELTSGSNPFAAGSLPATIARTLEVDPPPLSTVSPACPPELERIVARCLRKKPAERYGSTTDLVADLERIVREPRPDARATSATNPRWWWEFHQVTVSVIYILTMYPAWRVRPWLPRPWGALFLFGLLACAAAATTLRLHLWFSSRFYPAELTALRQRSARWIFGCDAGFTVALLLAALVIGDAHPAITMLLTTIGVASAVASFAIEPTAARAAFDDRASLT